MPEGDTLFRTARTLSRALTGTTITEFRTQLAPLARWNDERPVAGQTVDRVEARGKWLLMFFSGGGVLLTHLRMNGSWHIYRRGERWRQPGRNMRIVLENASWQAVGFSVPVAEVLSLSQIERDHRIPRPEIDVLRPEFDTVAAAARIRARSSEAIADVLLDQTVLAGVGNEFKSEICFACAVNPFAPIASLSDAHIAEIVGTALRMVRENILEDSDETTVTYRGLGRRTRHASDPRERVWVYGRAGETCRKCGTLIERQLQGRDARVTFWCPQCQPISSDQAMQVRR
ncbi:MAG: DNA-formamidopyrimidine glycosylase family protein [Terracidiphilus sp.]|nr:DNA-formamidopyrimidine glycosylase family protein [Terracidiphilus sp.]